MTTTATLTDRELAMLDLERSWWMYPGAKETEIRRRFDLSATQFYQQLNRLIDRDDSLAHDPLLVRRLRRHRAERQRTRSARRLGIDL